jgi:hypothetical protein
MYSQRLFNILPMQYIGNIYGTLNSFSNFSVLLTYMLKGLCPDPDPK